MAASGSAFGASMIPFNSQFESFLHPEKGYQNAESELQKWFEIAQKYNLPFMQQGKDQYGRLNGQADKLNDPAALEAEWSKGYEESPYAKQLTKEATASGEDAASSMGLLGSSAALTNIQKSAGDIMQSDRQKYMDDLMQKYMQSIGIGENLYGVGANSANELSKNTLQTGENMAGLKYGETNAPGEQFGKIAGAIGNAALNWSTGAPT
jgi:hypothetical protein